MTITIYHKNNEEYQRQIFNKVSARISDGVNFVDSGITNDCSATVRIFTKENISVFPYDKVIFGLCESITPPKDAYIIKKVYKNFGGILSHVRLDCVC